MSGGEQLVENVLIKYKIPYKKEKTFPGLVGDSGKPLRYDFYIKGRDRWFLLEVDGTQHRKKNRFYSEKLIRYDKMKDRYAEEHGIELYRLWYMSRSYGFLKRSLWVVLQIGGK